jgi:hypothetical protein
MYKNNLLYFLNNGIEQYIDYYIIINGDCSVDIPKKNNIKIIKRENIGFDFGAWGDVINNHINRDYDYYIFINTSVMGPYKYKYKYNNKHWLDNFLDLFNTEDVKLVGTTINILDIESIYNDDPNIIPPYTHVQSMFFIMNNKCLQFLKLQNFFNDDINNITDISWVIKNREIKMSKLILHNNWNINSILPEYKNLDYRLIKERLYLEGESDIQYKN